MQLAPVLGISQQAVSRLWRRSASVADRNLILGVLGQVADADITDKDAERRAL